MVSEVGNGQQWSKRQPGRKKEVRNKNGRKRSEKIFALYAPWYSRWASRQWSKRQPGIKMAEKGPKKGRKNFRALCAISLLLRVLFILSYSLGIVNFCAFHALGIIYFILICIISFLSGYTLYSFRFCKMRDNHFSRHIMSIYNQQHNILLINFARPLSSKNLNLIFSNKNTISLY